MTEVSGGHTRVGATEDDQSGVGGHTRVGATEDDQSVWIIHFGEV